MKKTIILLACLASLAVRAEDTNTVAGPMDTNSIAANPTNSVAPPPAPPPLTISLQTNVVARIQPIMITSAQFDTIVSNVLATVITNAVELPPVPINSMTMESLTMFRIPGGHYIVQPNLKL